MWFLTDERQIRELARVSRSLRTPCVAISPSTARQNPLDAPAVSSSSSSCSPGLWCGSCRLTRGVGGDQPCCKHSVSLTEVCRVRVRVFQLPFLCCSTSASAYWMWRCPHSRMSSIVPAEQRLPLSPIDGRLIFFLPALALWMWRAGPEMFKCLASYSPPFPF